MNFFKYSFVLFLLFSFVACKKDTVSTPIANIDCATVTFAQTVFPLIQQNCGSASCHGVGSGSGEMTNYEELKVFASNGALESRVLDTRDMPKGGSLSSEQLGQIKCWLDAGAPNN